MVSDFVEEHNGYLAQTEEEHQAAKEKYPTVRKAPRVSLEYGAEKGGYWMSVKFMVKVENACNIAESKYNISKHKIVWIFDQSSCDKKYDEHAFIAKNLLVKDGGDRRVCDTVWAGRPQEMLLPDGTQRVSVPSCMREGLTLNE